MPKVRGARARRVRFMPMASSVSPSSDSSPNSSHARRSDRAGDGSRRSTAQPNFEDEPIIEIKDFPALDPNRHATEVEGSPPPPSVTHLFINNKRVMSRARDWGSVLDPVGRCFLK